MPIYSNNRSGSMALAQVVANESYTSEDFGRILYESQLNDMAFFEAVLACDFNEINGLREGTILESEVAVLNEASLKELANKAIEGLKKFWAKLKGAFQDAINKIGSWIGNNGKALAKQVNSANVEAWSGKIEGVVTYNHEDPIVSNTLKHKISNDLFKAVGDADINVASIVGDYLGNKLGEGSVTPRDYTKKVFDKAKNVITVDKSNIRDIVEQINDGKFFIGAVKGYQKAAEDQINDSINELKNIAKAEGNAAKLNGIVHAYQTIVATLCKANIAVIRADMKSKSVAITRALSDIHKMNESADMEARCVADAFDEAMTGTLNMDAETKTAVTTLVAAC